jgi:site-specific DNA-adenine methylase
VILVRRNGKAVWCGNSGIILLRKPKVEEEFANDINSRLIKFWLCLQDKETMMLLQKMCLNVLDSKYVYELEKEKDPTTMSILKGAFNYVYLNRFGFNGYIDTYYTPLTHNKYKVKNFCGTLRNIARNFPVYYERIKNVHFTNYDFVEFIEKSQPQQGKFYIHDAPYFKTHQYNRGYKIGNIPDFGEEQYKKLRELCDKITDAGAYFMITCDATNPFLNNMKNCVYKIINRRHCINKSNIERKPISSKIIMNYDIKRTGSIFDLNKEDIGDSLEI